MNFNALYVLVLLCFITGQALSADFYDTLPSLPNYSEVDNDNKSRKGLIYVGGRIGQAVGASILSFIAFNLGRTILQSIQSKLKLKNPTNLSPTFIKLENETVSELKADQEEIWNAILKIHEMQSEQKSELISLREALNQELDSLTTTLNSLESKLSTLVNDADAMRMRLNGLSLKRLDEISESQDSLQEEVQKIAQSLESSEVRIARRFKIQEEEFNRELRNFRRQLLKYVRLQQQQRQSPLSTSTGTSPKDTKPQDKDNSPRRVLPTTSSSNSPPPPNDKTNKRPAKH
ncbi:hypothetical protein EON65_21775 [archaeon]|nr:MAG: hypothetical protein EON65_21775 [archaeon]